MNVHEVNIAAAKATAAQAPVQENKPVTGQWYCSDPVTKIIHHKKPPHAGETEISLRAFRAVLELQPEQLKIFNLPSAAPVKIEVKFAKGEKQEGQVHANWTCKAKTTLNQNSDLWKKISASLLPPEGRVRPGEKNPTVLEAYIASFSKTYAPASNEKPKVDAKKHK